MTEGLEYKRLDGGVTHPYREWGRECLPGVDPAGPEGGCVVTDIDMMVRRYCTENPMGTLLLMEMKHGPSKSVTGGQDMTLALLDEMCSGHPRYRGSYVTNYVDIAGVFTPLKVRRLTHESRALITVLTEPTLDEFREWMMDILDPFLPPL